MGGPGGFSASRTAGWLETIGTRGESGAGQPAPTDFGPWGGFISFDRDTAWHFGETTAGLETNESDFLSVAVHELAHLLGFGTAASWRTHVNSSDQSFTGPASVAEYDLGGAVPLSPGLGHWAEGTRDGGQEAAMDPSLTVGTRKGLTALDLAGLRDVGWDLRPVPEGLMVTSFTSTPSGFTATFNRPLDPGTLNLYAAETGSQGPADLTLLGETSGPVSGSLIVAPDGRSITFLRTGGPLPPDRYTVSLHAAAGGFADTAGGLLDGNGDGIPGDDFVATFTVEPAAAILVSIPDTVRGPGQPVDVPADGAGLPIRLSDGAGVTSVVVTLAWDPALLAITGVAPGPELPAGAQVIPDLTIPGRLVVAVAAPSGLPAGPLDLVRLTATVPGTAPYRAEHILDLSDVRLNGGQIGAIADDGLHVAAYFGDVTGNGAYSALDGQRVLRVAALLDTGFAAFLLTDPVLLGDTTGNGAISALDGTRVLQEVVGLDRPEIPPLPGNVVLAAGLTLLAPRRAQLDEGSPAGAGLDWGLAAGGETDETPLRAGTGGRNRASAPMPTGTRLRTEQLASPRPRVPALPAWVPDFVLNLAHGGGPLGPNADIMLSLPLEGGPPCRRGGATPHENRVCVFRA